MAETATVGERRVGEELRKRPYVLVFAILAVVTAIELNVTIFGLQQATQITLLIVLATVKASLVVAYYMHLRYEPRRLALIPLAGLALVALLVLALLSGEGAPHP